LVEIVLATPAGSRWVTAASRIAQSAYLAGSHPAPMY